MANLNDPEVHKLLTEPNYAVVSTYNKDGSIHSTVAWIDLQDGRPAVNSAKGRISAVVIESGNPYNFVELRGTAQEVDGADEHINGLAKKYIDQDEYPFRAPGEVRVKFEIEPDHARHQKRG